MSYEVFGDNDDSPFESAIEAGWLNPEDLSKALIDVMNERDRQWNEEGWTPEHDDAHQYGELAMAAAAYACNTPTHRKQIDVFANRIGGGQSRVGWFMPHLLLWPFEQKWWKPRDARADLVRAGALILAEIERLDRAEKKANATEAQS